MVDDLVDWAQKKPGVLAKRVMDDPHEADAHVNWVKGYWQTLRSYSPRGAYVNFLTDEGTEQQAPPQRPIGSLHRLTSHLNGLRVSRMRWTNEAL